MLNKVGKFYSKLPVSFFCSRWFIWRPFSGFDARYLKWLADEYGVKVVVKRGWKDLLSAVFVYD